MRGEAVEAAGGNSAERAAAVERLIARRLRETAWGAAHAAPDPPPPDPVARGDTVERRDDAGELHGSVDPVPPPHRARRSVLRRSLAVLERAVRRVRGPGRGR